MDFTILPLTLIPNTVLFSVNNSIFKSVLVTQFASIQNFASLIKYQARINVHFLKLQFSLWIIRTVYYDIAVIIILEITLEWSTFWAVLCVCKHIVFVRLNRLHKIWQNFSIHFNFFIFTAYIDRIHRWVSFDYINLTLLCCLYKLLSNVHLWHSLLHFLFSGKFIYSCEIALVHVKPE